MHNDSLKKKAFSSILWSAIDRFSSQGIAFIIGLILARILLPADYGLIGMLTIFIVLSQSLTDSGFSTALIQKKDTNNVDYSTIFYVNIFISLLVYIILFFSAKYISEFFGEPLLIDLTKVVGINVIINSLSIVQRAKLTRELEFKKQTKISVLSVIISGSVGVYLALNGYGVWALVYQTILRNVVSLVLFWTYSKWIPELLFSIKSLKSLFGFGSRILIWAVINSIFENIYFVVVGKYYSAQDLGYYTRAQQFKQLPASNITAILQRVTLPVFSQIQDDNIRLKIGYKKAIKLVAFIMFPLMTGLALIAKPLILTILTVKWLPAVALLQILSFEGILYPIHALNLNILNVKGYSNLFLRLDLIKKALIVVVIIVTISISIKAMVIGYLILSVISFFINTYYSKRFINYGAIEQIRDIAPYFFATAVMAILNLFILTLIDSYIYELIISIIFCGGFYFLIAYLFKFSELVELKSFFNNRKNSE
ncbi:MAG: lipopolysaccharide biosynthesis protein [Salinivirgaceae bacterium]|nr:lipopolysaccharide biosynthesis protein [Salinivirgaceae bacterium]